jgi:hypothetical protein
MFRIQREGQAIELTITCSAMRYGVEWLNMTSTLTIDESKSFLALCRSGRLYDVERWIAAGNSIVTHPSTKRTPLLTAIDTGFHSLVELLARNEPRQEQKDRVLGEAVERIAANSRAHFSILLRPRLFHLR